MGDTISRQAAIDEIRKCRFTVDAIEKIRALPSAQPEVLACGEGELSAQPEQRWIPVTERLPEDDTEVVVSCTDDSGDSEFSYTTTGWHFKGLWVVGNERSCFVRAWQPLPEPYKSESEG